MPRCMYIVFMILAHNSLVFTLLHHNVQYTAHKICSPVVLHTKISQQKHAARLPQFFRVSTFELWANNCAGGIIASMCVK